MAHALRRQLAGLVEQGVRGLLVEHDGHGGRGGFYIAHGPQAEVGQLVGGILAVLIQAPHVQVGIAVIAAKDVGHLGGLEPYVGRHLDVQLLNQLHGLLRGEDALFHVRLVVGVHVLVKTGPGNGGACPLYEEEEADSPGRLAGVIEGGRGTPGDPFHHLRHLLQLLLALGVLLRLRSPGTGCAEPLPPVPNGL